MGIKIISTGRKLPKHIVTNQQLAEFLDTSDEWITSKTGISTRTICTEENLTSLATDAALIALDKANISDKSSDKISDKVSDKMSDKISDNISGVDMIIGATFTGDYSTPSLACCVAEKLVASGVISAGIPAFDISAACSGFIYALDIADSTICAGKAEKVLIVAAEMMSKVVDWNDRSSCILFGDGAGACVVTKGDSLKYIRTAADAQVAPLFAKSFRGNNPFIDKSNAPEVSGHASSTCYLEMQGQHVYKFAVKAIESEIHLALSALNLKAEDVDYFILHQANTRIIDGARTRLKLPAEKFPMNIGKYGNMSAASIPVLLDEMAEENRIKPGDTLMLIGFGAGMTAGCAVLQW